MHSNERLLVAYAVENVQTNSGFSMSLAFTRESSYCFSTF